MKALTSNFFYRVNDKGFIIENSNKKRPRNRTIIKIAKKKHVTIIRDTNNLKRIEIHATYRREVSSIAFSREQFQLTIQKNWQKEIPRYLN